MTTLLLKSFKTLRKLNSINISYDLRPNRKISYLLTKLTERQVIGVEGNDSYDYIQGLTSCCNRYLYNYHILVPSGLVTNDIRHLSPTRETSVCYDCINSFMLNTTGRVISDLFIYKYDKYLDDKNTKHLLLEMDSKLSSKIVKFLKAYRIRRKVSIEQRDDFEVWSLFPSVDRFDDRTIEQMSEKEINFDDLNDRNNIVIRDPRLKQIGFRVLVNTQNKCQTIDKIKEILHSKSLEFNETDVNSYHKFRYRLGVGEGVRDFPIENCFPLECNGDFLPAISFYKG